MFLTVSAREYYITSTHAISQGAQRKVLSNDSRIVTTIALDDLVVAQAIRFANGAACYKIER